VLTPPPLPDHTVSACQGPPGPAVVRLVPPNHRKVGIVRRSHHPIGVRTAIAGCLQQRLALGDVLFENLLGRRIDRPVAPGRAKLFRQVVRGHPVQNIVRRRTLIDHYLGESGSHVRGHHDVQDHLDICAAGRPAKSIEQHRLRGHLRQAGLGSILLHVARVKAVKFKQPDHLAAAG
jgi:hypothetical protein